MVPQKNEVVSIFKIADSAIVYNRTTKRSYKLGRKEYNLFLKIDGQTTISQLSQITGYSVEAIKEMLTILQSHQLLFSGDLTCDRQAKKKHAIVYDTSFLAIFAKPFLRYTIDFLLMAALPLLLFSIIFMRGKIDTEGILNSVSLGHFIVMDCFLAISVGLHELAHAVTAINSGAFCAEIGYKWNWIFPSAYTTLCGIDEIKTKWKRIRVFYSGIALNALVAGVALLLMNVGALRDNPILFVLFCANILLVLINSILFIKSDLYYMLCCLLNDNDLRENLMKTIKNKHCISVGKIVYFLTAFIIEPAAILTLLVIAFGKIGGNVL